MLAVGVDIHKKTLTICVLDESDKPVITKRIENTVEKVVEFFSPYRGDARVAIEPTHNWGPIHDLLTEMGFECKVSDPRQNRLIGKAVVKTDRLDAKRLATLFRVDMLPLCYAAPSDVRRRREKVRARASLVRTCTSLKNQLRAQLTRSWITCPLTDVSGKGGRAFVSTLEWDDDQKAVARMRLDLIAQAQVYVQKLEDEISHDAQGDLRAQLLMTIPGIAEYSSSVILAEIGDIDRFARAESLVAYAGLCVSEDSSGESVRRGRITKCGSAWLRWVLVEAALHTVTQEGKIRDLYERVEKKKGHSKAIVAAARELLVSIFWMLKRMEPYRPSGKKVSFAGEVR